MYDTNRGHYQFQSSTKWKNYVLTEEGKEKKKLMDMVEGAINVAFKDKKGIKDIKEDNERAEMITRIANDAVRVIVNADALNVLESKRQREQEEEERLKNNVVRSYETFLADIKDGSIRQKKFNKSYTKSTIKVWDGFGKHLRKFCKNKKPITFETIDQSTADKFTLFLEREGLLPKTINKQIGCFKRLCNWAATTGVNKNAVSLRVWNEKTIGEKEHKAVYLTETEINALYEMELTGTRAQVRDLFFMGYLTSQRFSDYANLTRDNFKRTDNGTDIIAIVQQKTGNYIEIPVYDSRITDIAKRYNYSFPQIKLQDFSDVLKTVLKILAETVPSLKEEYTTALTQAERGKEKSFTALMQKEADGKPLTKFEVRKLREMRQYAEQHNGKPLYGRNVGGVPIRYKYELISSHSARRSGITNMVKDGILTEREMMSISGHTTEKNFNTYVRLGTREQVERIAEKLREKRRNENV